jgi:hypothetical protein
LWVAIVDERHLIDAMSTAASAVWPERRRIEDRPWGATLAALGLGGRTGQLTLRLPNGRQHAIAFIHGAVVGATSPVVADSVARIAVRSRIITAKQAAAVRGRVRSDDLTAFAGTTGLAAEDAQRLEERVVLERAARTFAIERGEYAIEQRISIPVSIGIEVDVRAVVYRGARLVLEGDRLTSDLRRFGKRFILTGEIIEISRFGFTEIEQPVLAALRNGTSGPELEALRRELDPRMVQAVIYALAACGAIRRITPTPPMTRPTTDQTSCIPMLIRHDVNVDYTAPPSTRRPSTLGRGTKRWTEPFLDARPTTVRPNALAAPTLRALIAAGSEMLEHGVDHFTMLGVPIGASVEAVKIAYVELARNLRPERLVELGIRDLHFGARALLAQICIAYTALTEPTRRAAYIAGLGRGGNSHEIDFDKLAAEAFARGERALRADEPELAVAELQTACELAPDDIDYIATLARAEFAAKHR